MAEKIEGTPISGGDHAGYPKQNAYDNNPATIWASAQAHTAGNNKAYVGLYAAGQKVHVGRIDILTNGPKNTPSRMSLRYSDNGTVWRTIHVFDSFAHSPQQQELIVPAHVDGAAYIALWCDAVSLTSDASANSFAITELSFYGMQRTKKRVVSPSVICSLPASLTRGFR